MIKNKSVLVTGGAGFIGSNLCEELLKRGNAVSCVDNLITGNIRNIQSFGDLGEFKFINADVNSNSFIELIKKDNFDYIFHYAAFLGVDRTIKHPTKVLNDVNSFKLILDYALKNGVKKVIFSSSSEVYGEPIEIPEKEEGILNAKQPYAVTNLVGEKYMESYFKEFGLKTLSLRFFNVYGPKQDSTKWGFVVGIFIKNALVNKPLPVIGDGTQTRDFMFIKDNIQASLMTADSHKCFNTAINIGTGKETRIIDLAKEINRLTSNKAGIEFIKERGYEIKRRCADISRLKSLTGFKPKHTLEGCLKDTINWFKNEK